MKGHRFQLFKGDDGLWYWHLRGSNHPQVTPIAQSGLGYPSQAAAERSMWSVHTVIKGVIGDDGQLRIERRTS